MFTFWKEARPRGKGGLPVPLGALPQGGPCFPLGCSIRLFVRSGVFHVLAGHLSCTSGHNPKLLSFLLNCPSSGLGGFQAFWVL